MTFIKRHATMLYLLGKEILEISSNSQQIYKLNENGIYCSVQKLELTMHYAFRKYFFLIFYHLFAFITIHFNNHRILFFQRHKPCYKWKLVLMLIKIYKTIDVLYKTTLYVNLFPKTSFSFFLAWLKKNLL